jgi:hypothetical protein
MKKFKVIQTYRVQDIWENVEAKDEQEAIDICMGGRFIDETKDLENTTETKVEEIKKKGKL